MEPEVVVRGGDDCDGEEDRGFYGLGLDLVVVLVQYADLNKIGDTLSSMS